MAVSYVTGRVEIEWSTSAEGDRVRLVGQLDELASLADFTGKLGGEVRFDLEQLTFINSMGLREWVRTLDALQGRNAHVTLARCSEAMVRQMNAVVVARGSASIESFFAPYECRPCDRVDSICLEVISHLDTLRELRFPTRLCAGCGAPMEPIELAESYLLFLES